MRWEGIKLEFGIIIIDKCGLKSQIRRLITFLHIGKPFFIPKGNSIICPVACDVFYTTLDYRISMVPPSYFQYLVLEIFYSIPLFKGYKRINFWFTKKKKLKYRIIFSIRIENISKRLALSTFEHSKRRKSNYSEAIFGKGISKYTVYWKEIPTKKKS